MAKATVSWEQFYKKKLGSMSTHVKFKDVFGEELTIQQIDLASQEYEAEFYVDGSLKKIYSYVNGNIDYGVYYLALEENLESILAQNSNTWRIADFYMNKQIIGNYSIEDWETYEGLAKIHKGKNVYDNSGRLICYISTSLDGSIVTSTNKIHYLESYGVLDFDHDIPNYGTLDFTYNTGPNSSISVEVNLPGFQHKVYDLSNEDNILSHPMLTPIFNWNDHPYYHNADPLVPTATV